MVAGPVTPDTGATNGGPLFGPAQDAYPGTRIHLQPSGGSVMLKYMRARLARLRKDDGQTMIEYALLAFLVAIVSIIFLSAIGLDLAETYDAVENALGIGATNDATTGPGVSDAASLTAVH